jgi:hypothetical protein
MGTVLASVGRQGSYCLVGMLLGTNCGDGRAKFARRPALIGSGERSAYRQLSLGHSFRMSRYLAFQLEPGDCIGFARKVSSEALQPPSHVWEHVFPVLRDGTTPFIG